ncbi:hypothetical protein GCM10011381_10620 [Klenkia taihuensis]|nr:hypothetical protein GCM10011381_10620 [Klenkia taihuensis]
MHTTNEQRKKDSTMSSVTSTWRQRREASRTRRALDKALARTSSPAMRDDLLTLANSQFSSVLR